MARESQVRTSTEGCSPCVHFDFCLVNWGTKCKRQGGTKIPRMKSRYTEETIIVDLRTLKKPDRPLNTFPRKKTVELVDPIRTKAFNW